VVISYRSFQLINPHIANIQSNTTELIKHAATTWWPMLREKCYNFTKIMQYQQIYLVTTQ